jgi:hypothetical protein
MLARFLHFLALDFAERSFQKLAYLTCKSSGLKKLACKVERPLVLEIHWGDGSIEAVEDETCKHANMQDTRMLHPESTLCVYSEPAVATI